MRQSKSPAPIRLCHFKALWYGGVARFSRFLPNRAFRLMSLSTVKASAQFVKTTQSDLLRAAQAEQLRLQTILNLRHQALLEATAAATEADRVRARLMTQIGHDLRAPLNAIMGYANLLARRDGDSRAHALKVLRSSSSLLAQINGLMQRARGGAQPPTLYSQPLSLSALLRGVAAFAAQVALRNDNRFRYQVAPALPDVVEVDGRRLQQVLEHLLANAAEFTSRGCIELSVDDQTSDDLSKITPLALVFTVSDTGPGLPARTLATMFEPFQGRAPLWRQECRGLGLAITHKWVLRMGGRMEVSSQPGNGTQMRVFLPVMPPSKAAVPHPRVTRDEGAPPRMQDADGLLCLVFKTIRRLIIKNTQANVLTQTQHENARLEESIRVRTREVEDAVLSAYEDKQARTHLLGLVSTRLRVPVDDIIRGTGRMVCREKIESAHQEIILRSALRLRSLVNDLIQYSQPDADLNVPAPPVVATRRLLTGSAGQAQQGLTLHAPPFDVFPEPGVLLQVADLIQIGAVSDLMDWASSVDARQAKWSHFAGVVGELAGQGDLQGLSNLLQVSTQALAALSHEPEPTPQSAVAPAMRRMLKHGGSGPVTTPTG